MKKQLLVSVVGLIVLTAQAWAGVVPGRWEKVDSLKSGADIIVIMQSGDSFRGSFRSSDSESVTVKTGGEDRSFPKHPIKQIEAEGVKEDGAIDGGLIGAGIGAAVGALLGSRSRSDDFKGTATGLLALVGAGIGFGVGYAADSGSGKPVLLYQAAGELAAVPE